MSSHSTDEQSATAKLRESYLRRLMSLKGKQCSLKLYENTDVRGIFRGTDPQTQDILIDELETPAGIIPHTIIRANDAISIEFTE